MKTFFQKILGVTTWKKEWQEQLSQVLSSAQKGLSVSMVVVIARESDLYAEVLFLLSFLGMSVAAVVAYLLRGQMSDAEDLILVPVMGFAFGSTLFAFKRFFLNRLAPRAIRDRVSGRAKSIFFDHERNLKGRLALLYFSELEREALFLSSPDLVDKTPSKEVQTILSRLLVGYEAESPMSTLGPALISLGDVLRIRYGALGDDTAQPTNPSPIYVGPSDRPTILQIPILKGSKDIN